METKLKQQQQHSTWTGLCQQWTLPSPTKLGHHIRAHNDSMRLIHHHCWMTISHWSIVCSVTRCSASYCLCKKSHPAMECTTATKVSFERQSNGEVKATLTTCMNDPRTTDLWFNTGEEMWTCKSLSMSMHVPATWPSTSLKVSHNQKQLLKYSQTPFHLSESVWSSQWENETSVLRKPPQPATL